MRTVALEEHFWTPELAELTGRSPAVVPGGDRDRRLRDLGRERLAEMDAAGITVQVISHNTPAAQGLPPKQSRALAADANNVLAAAVRAHPDRFAGFATLPTADPHAAADELERCVRELGFVGAMVNSTLGTNGQFLDDPFFEPLLDRFEELGVPLYLHPSAPPAELSRLLYHGFTPPVTALLSTAGWGWHAESGLSILRLVLSGVLQRRPNLRVIAGHCGEMLPFMLDRIDQVLPPQVTGLSAPPSHYLLRQVWVTTSGMFTVAPLMCTIQVWGVERVLFSVDYPYSSNADGRAVLDVLPLSPADRARVAAGNADALLGLHHRGTTPAV